MMKCIVGSEREGCNRFGRWYFGWKHVLWWRSEDFICKIIGEWQSTYEGTWWCNDFIYL